MTDRHGDWTTHGDLRAEQPHQARRGDEVEAWLKRHRDAYPDTSIAWIKIDGLLDDYRLHADTGTPLSGEVDEETH